MRLKVNVKKKGKVWYASPEGIGAIHWGDTRADLRSRMFKSINTIIGSNTGKGNSYHFNIEECKESRSIWYLKSDFSTLARYVLIAFRKLRDYSKADMNKLCGFKETNKYYYKLENGDRELSPDKLETILELLDCPPVEFIIG